MHSMIVKYVGVLAIGSSLLIVPQAHGEQGGKEKAEHGHNHAAQGHSHSSEKSVYKGYFEDSEIKTRELLDWKGKWQSVYPYLLDGTLAPVMAHKAKKGDKTAEEYREYYETGYKTDVSHIDIEGDRVTFYKNGGSISGRYVADGYEVLTYKKGNRGVRYIFKKTEGDSEAPQFIQFSDHRIAPEQADHYHLYWGTDRAALLKEVTNWPTYYPSSLSGEQIVSEMMAH